MADPFRYLPDQIAQIKAAFDAKDYPTAYRLAAMFADSVMGADQRSVAWLRGAADVNANTGSYAAFRLSLYKEASDGRAG